MIQIRDLSYKSLLLFSIPSILSSLLEPLASIVDTSLVGRLNTDWLGALAICTIIFSSFTWVFNFLIHASTQSVSQVVSEPAKLGGRVKVSLGFAIGIGLVSSLMLFFFRSSLYQLAGAKQSLIPLIEAYFIIRLIGHPFTLIYTTLLSILRGLGKVSVSFYVVLGTTLLNILISWYLLYRLNWGLAGVAWGTVISNILGVFISVGFVFTHQSIRNHFWLSEETGKWFKFGKNSLDIFGRSAMLTGCFFLGTRLASGLGVIELAAYQILIQVWLFASFFLDGIAVTGTVLGAHYLETKMVDKLKTIYSRLLWIGFFLGIAFSLSYFAFGKMIWTLFTLDMAVISVIVPLWPLIYGTQIINSVAFVYDGLLFGLEEFAYLRKWMIMGVLGIFLPLALVIFWKGHLGWLISAFIGLNIFRIVTGMIRVNQKVFQNGT